MGGYATGTAARFCSFFGQYFLLRTLVLIIRQLWCFCCHFLLILCSLFAQKLLTFCARAQFSLWLYRPEIGLHPGLIILIFVYCHFVSPGFCLQWLTWVFKSRIMQLKYCRKCYAETAEIDDVAEEDIHNFFGCDFV
jgi:hypothetical protein